MSQGIRRPIYLSPTKDSDILDYIKPLEENYSFSSIMKELARDGIKYRAAPNNFQNLVSLSHTSPPVNIQLKRKEVTDEELDDMLDNF
jgi:hypothetical protein